MLQQLIQTLLTDFEALAQYLLSNDQGLLLERLNQDHARYQYFLASQGTILMPCHGVMTPVPEMQPTL